MLEQYCSVVRGKTQRKKFVPFVFVTCLSKWYSAQDSVCSGWLWSFTRFAMRKEEAKEMEGSGFLKQTKTRAFIHGMHVKKDNEKRKGLGALDDR